MKIHRLAFSLVFLTASLSLAQEKIYQVTTPLPTARQMYGAVAVGDFVYIIGGNIEPGDIYTRAVQKALIRPDGTLGPWEDTTALPTSRCYIENLTLAINGVLYVVEGVNGDTLEKEKTILWSRPAADGHLAPWQESSPCPAAVGVSCSVAVATSQYIHLLGGSIGGGTPTDEVWSAQLGPDGAVLGWKQGPVLPVPLWYHCAGIVGETLYVWGGLTSKDPYATNITIYSAPILPTGELGEWVNTGAKLPRGFYSASSTSSGKFLLSFCPRYAGSESTGDIWFNSLTPSGLSEWKHLPGELPVTRYVSLASDRQRGFVFLLGGRVSKEDRNLDPNVYCFALAPAAAPPAAPAPAPASYAAGGGHQQSAPLPAPAANQPPTLPEPQTATAVAPPAAPPTEPPKAPPTAPPAAYVARTNGDFLPGFISYRDAEKAFQARPVATIIYFHSPGDPQCQVQAQILGTFQPAYYSGKALFVQVNPHQAPEIAQRYAVSQAPAWIFYDEKGNQIAKHIKVLQPDELVKAITLILP